MAQKDSKKTIITIIIAISAIIFVLFLAFMKLGSRADILITNVEFAINLLSRANIIYLLLSSLLGIIVYVVAGNSQKEIKKIPGLISAISIIPGYLVWYFYTLSSNKFYEDIYSGYFIVTPIIASIITLLIFQFLQPFRKKLNNKLVEPRWSRYLFTGTILLPYLLICSLWAIALIRRL